MNEIRESEPGCLSLYPDYRGLLEAWQGLELRVGSCCIKSTLCCNGLQQCSMGWWGLSQGQRVCELKEADTREGSRIWRKWRSVLPEPNAPMTAAGFSVMSLANDIGAPNDMEQGWSNRIDRYNQTHWGPFFFKFLVLL